jgi:hypothetical protein
MKRKDKTVKQLQAECRKRKVGFMMNWTKVALIKRLEDEDKRDKGILELEKKADKILVKKEGELSQALNRADTARQRARVANSETAIAKKALGKLDMKTVEQNAIDNLAIQKQGDMNLLQTEFDALQIKQNEILKENSVIASRKAVINKEIESLKILIKSLI